MLKIKNLNKSFGGLKAVNAVNLEGAVNMVKGSAVSMGMEVSK